MDKDPVTRAREVYANEVCARSFDEDFNLHVDNPLGIVYKDRDSLALLRPVHTDDTYQNLTNPSYNHPDPNCWWVYIFVGNFPRLLSFLPCSYKYIGWERNNEPRFYKLNKLISWTLKDPTLTHRLLGRTAN